MKNCELDLVATDVKQAVKNLKTHGITIFRKDCGNTFTQLKKKTDDILKTPSILGSLGYHQKDCHKKLYHGLLIGEEAINIVTSNDVIHIAEGYLERPGLLQEMFIKNDLGDGELYFPMHAHTGKYREKQNPGPFSTGIILYMHDTEDGAFCFAPGTHEWDCPYGGELCDYPPEKQKEINEKMRRIPGKAGDIVIFDHRGFHGPEQPVTVPRTVFLGGIHAAEDHGNKVKHPTPVYAHNLRGLSKDQLRILGLESDGCIINEKNFHLHYFKKENKVAYAILSLLAKGYFGMKLLEFKTRDALKNVLGKSKATK